MLDSVIQKGVARETTLALPATQAMGAQRQEHCATEVAGMGGTDGGAQMQANHDAKGGVVHP